MFISARRLMSAALVAIVVVAVLSVAPARAQSTAPSDDQLWNDFVTWLQALPPTTQVLSVVQLYTKDLIGKGASPDAAKATMGRLLTLMRDRPDAWRPIFNRIYTTPGATFRTEPSAVLVAAVEGRKPGRALDVGMGQGRNSVLLALKGWDVTGFDLSDEGLAAARAQAARGGTSIKTVQADASSFDYGRDQWDLIVVTYGPGFLFEPAQTARLQQALRAGGLLVVESFASDKAAPGRRPVDIDPAELLRLYSGYRFIRFEDVDGISEWDPQTTRLVRMIAQKRL